MGFNMSLGSGINLIREPRDGRTFEYKGEDPLLAGTLAGQELKAEESSARHHRCETLCCQRSGSRPHLCQLSHRQAVNAGKRPARFSDRTAGFGAGRGDVLLQPHQWNLYACEDYYTLNEVLKKELRIQGICRSQTGVVRRARRRRAWPVSTLKCRATIPWRATEEGCRERRSANGSAQRHGPSHSENRVRFGYCRRSAAAPSLTCPTWLRSGAEDRRKRRRAVEECHGQLPLNADP